jgi:phage FluMu protein Com
MPIRFRCAYCNQLMGIARRKAGTIVRCPACASQVTVPHPPGEGAVQARVDEPFQQAVDDAPPPLFERSDFDDLFNPRAGKARQAPAPFVYESFVPPSPAEHFDKAQPQQPPAQVGPADQSAPAPVPGPMPGRPGIWLTPGLATLLSVSAVVAMALAFGAGLLVGIFLRPTEDQSRRPLNPTAITRV